MRAPSGIRTHSLSFTRRAHLPSVLPGPVGFSADWLGRNRSSKSVEVGLGVYPQEQASSLKDPVQLRHRLSARCSTHVSVRPNQHNLDVSDYGRWDRFSPHSCLGPSPRASCVAIIACFYVGALGFEPRTHGLRARSSGLLSYTPGTVRHRGEPARGTSRGSRTHKSLDHRV